MMNKILALSIFMFAYLSGFAQPVPAEEENIPFLVTFGKQAETSWGDDDFTQVFFFAVPSDFKKAFYIRVFDPDCGGQHDESNEGFDTYTKFSVYGGMGCITEDDAREVDPIGNWKSGNLLGSKVFSNDNKYDNQWYTFGPFNPTEGERSEKWGGNIFKVICEGVRGNDGNVYRYFMSTEPDKNVAVEGGNIFTFEYSFRMHSEPWQKSHVYPYVDDAVISLKQNNFDWDDDGYIQIVSVKSVSENVATSGDDRWSTSSYKVSDEERGTSLDIQFIKDDKLAVNNNNVVFYITNQYGELLPFYNIPIGGIPRPKGKGKLTPLNR